MADPQRRKELTPQQRACLQLVGQGYKSKQIGRIIQRSPSTVDNHIYLACQALGVTDRDEAARLLGDDAGQGLPRLTPTVANPAPPLDLPGSIGGRLRRWSERNLPPIGGWENDLTVEERLRAGGRIIFLAAVLTVMVVIVLKVSIRLLS